MQDKRTGFAEEEMAGNGKNWLKGSLSAPYERYTKGAFLGAGAMKKVYKAFDEREGIEVAWNEVHVSDVQFCNGKDKNRIYSEIRVLEQLKHRNIMQLFDWWYDAQKQKLIFITELFTDGSLRMYRRRHRWIEEQVLKRWAWQILQGLVYLHGHNPPIIHRDLKADNIFVNGASGQVKIGDLGFATLQRGLDTRLSVIGTPEFMAPELYDEVYDEKVDIYAYGMCLLELATMDYPYSECQNPAQVYRKVTRGIPPEGLSKVSSDEVRAFISKCINPDPQERPPSHALVKDPFFDCVRNLRSKSCVQLGARRRSGCSTSSCSSSGASSPTQPQSPHLSCCSHSTAFPDPVHTASSPSTNHLVCAVRSKLRQDLAHVGVDPTVDVRSMFDQGHASGQGAVDDKRSSHHQTRLRPSISAPDMKLARIGSWPAVHRGVTVVGPESEDSLHLYSRFSYTEASSSRMPGESLKVTSAQSLTQGELGAQLHLALGQAQSGDELSEEDVLFSGDEESVPHGASQDSHHSSSGCRLSSPFAFSNTSKGGDQYQVSAMGMDVDLMSAPRAIAERRSLSSGCQESEEHDEEETEDEDVKISCRRLLGNQLSFNMSFFNCSGYGRKIGFQYDLAEDTAETIVQEMLESLSMKPEQADIICKKLKQELGKITEGRASVD